MKYATQTGFSLVEVIITIAIIGILTAGLMTALSSGDDSKITALFSKSQDIAKSVTLYQAKTGCVPNQLAVLFDKPLATAANNYCGQATTALYGNEDYIAALPTTNPATGAAIPNNGLDLTKVGFANSYIWIAQNFGGIQDYVLEIGGLATEDQQKFVGKCDGADYTGGTVMPVTAAIVTTPCVSDGAGNVAMLITKY